MALALEGTPVHGNATSGTSIVSAAFTTAAAAEVFIAATINGSTVSSITGGGLTWALRKSQNNGSAQPIEVWAAKASAALSGVQLTVNFAGAVSYVTIDVFAFSGQDTSTIWDANASVPASAAAISVSISTSNADDVIIGAARMGGVQNPTQAATFTKVSGADFQLTEYKIVAATQSGLSVGVGTGDPDAFIADALMQASAAGGPTYPQLERNERGANRGMPGRVLAPIGRKIGSPSLAVPRHISANERGIRRAA